MIASSDVIDDFCQRRFQIFSTRPRKRSGKKQNFLRAIYLMYWVNMFNKLGEIQQCSASLGQTELALKMAHVAFLHMTVGAILTASL